MFPSRVSEFKPDKAPEGANKESSIPSMPVLKNFRDRRDDGREDGSLPAGIAWFPVIFNCEIEGKTEMSGMDAGIAGAERSLETSNFATCKRIMLIKKA